MGKMNCINDEETQKAKRTIAAYKLNDLSLLFAKWNDLLLKDDLGGVLNNPGELCRDFSEMQRIMFEFLMACKCDAMTLDIF